VLRLVDGWRVACVAFSPDGGVLAAGSWLPAKFPTAGLLRFWRVAAGWEPVAVPTRNPVECLAFHPAGRTLAHLGVPAARTAEFLRPDTVHLYPLTGADEFEPHRLDWAEFGPPGGSGCSGRGRASGRSGGSSGAASGRRWPGGRGGPTARGRPPRCPTGTGSCSPASGA